MSDEEESVYIRNAERQRILKQRDESYRKFLIEESKREESKWDSFSENEAKEEEEEAKEEEKEAKEPPKKEKKPMKDRKRKAPVDEPLEDTKDDVEISPAVEERPVVKAKMPKFKPAKAEVPEVPKKKLKKKKGEQKATAKNKAEENQLDSTTESSGVTSLAEASNTMMGNSQLLCLGCRESGHRLKTCPKFKTAVCIKCGSTDHKYKECPTGGDFKFATCFVCKEVVSCEFSQN